VLPIGVYNKTYVHSGLTLLKNNVLLPQKERF